MTVSRRSAVIVIVLVAIVAIVAAWYTPKLLNWDNNDDYGDVSVQEAKVLIDEKPSLVILDVRTVTEFNDGHIEGATNIPVDELADRLSEFNTSDEILVYCRTGNRSATAMSILEDAGYTRLFHIHEGISVWIQQGYPVVQ
jgi:rhodanese-related sulfurtransferase